jgi:hypothetical protein
MTLPPMTPGCFVVGVVCRVAQEEKLYVQHRMREHGAKLVSMLLDDVATLYICGDGASMARDVEATVKQLFQVCVCVCVSRVWSAALANGCVPRGGGSVIPNACTHTYLVLLSAAHPAHTHTLSPGTQPVATSWTAAIVFFQNFP